MTEISIRELIAAAQNARLRAHTPYSQFKVGAALLTEEGRIYTGCNIENASYGLTICAERVAIFKALSEGDQAFTKIAVVADTSQLTPPCGACRQILWEFCGDVAVILANLEGQSEQHRMGQLLPNAFDGRFL